MSKGGKIQLLFNLCYHSTAEGQQPEAGEMTLLIKYLEDSSGKML